MTDGFASCRDVILDEGWRRCYNQIASRTLSAFGDAVRVNLRNALWDEAAMRRWVPVSESIEELAEREEA